MVLELISILALLYVAASFAFALVVIGYAEGAGRRYTIRRATLVGFAWPAALLGSIRERRRCR